MLLDASGMSRSWSSSATSKGNAAGKGDTLVKRPANLSDASVASWTQDSKQKSVLTKLADAAEVEQACSPYDLHLFHGQAARVKEDKAKKRMKRPPINAAENLRTSTPQGEKKPASSSTGCHRRSNLMCGSTYAAVSEVQQLCNILTKSRQDHVRQMEDIERGVARSSSKPANKFEGVRRGLESQFKDSIRIQGGSIAGDNLEVVPFFSSFIIYLLEGFGTLAKAMDHLGRSLPKKGRLTHQQFISAVADAGFDDELITIQDTKLGKIFRVLDQDNDGDITYEDVTCYQPRTGAQYSRGR
jgi:hypothetical protein